MDSGNGLCSRIFLCGRMHTVNRRGGQFWCIQITDKKLLEEIKKVIKSEHKISIRIGGRNESTLYRLQIGSIEMCDDLRKLGLRERKTKNLVVPNVPDKYFADFVRGYFDGDGNVWIGFLNKKRSRPSLALKTMFTSCSSGFLNQFHKRLRKFGAEGVQFMSLEGIIRACNSAQMTL